MASDDMPTIGEDWEEECRKLAEEIVRQIVPQREVDRELTVSAIAGMIYRRFFVFESSYTALTPIEPMSVEGFTIDAAPIKADSYSNEAVASPDVPLSMEDGPQQWDAT